jgi:hypothetical protein
MQLGIEKGVSTAFHIDPLISSVDVVSGADNIERTIIKEYKNKIVPRITLVRAGTFGPPHRLLVMLFGTSHQRKLLRRAYRL